MTVLLMILMRILNSYVAKAFSVDVWTSFVVPLQSTMLGFLIYELLVLLVITSIFSWIYVRYLIGRVRWEK